MKLELSPTRLTLHPDHFKSVSWTLPWGRGIHGVEDEEELLHKSGGPPDVHQKKERYNAGKAMTEFSSVCPRRRKDRKCSCNRPLYTASLIWRVKIKNTIPQDFNLHCPFPSDVTLYFSCYSWINILWLWTRYHVGFKKGKLLLPLCEIDIQADIFSLFFFKGS